MMEESVRPFRLHDPHGSGDKVGSSPLAFDALRGHTDCALTLLSHRCPQGSHFCALTLLSHGESARCKDTACGRTPIHLAVMNGHTQCVRLLLEDSNSANLVDAADSQGQTPLMLAVLGVHTDCGLCLALL